MQSQIQKAKAAFSKLYQRVWSRCTLSLKTYYKDSVYSTMIIPILTQDCETLHFSYHHFKKMESCQYRFLCTICNKRWEDFVHYTQLFDIMKASKITVPLLEILIRKKTLSFWNRIMSMDNDRLIKKCYFLMPLKERENLVALCFPGANRSPKILKL